MLKKQLVENRIEIGCDEAGRGCLAGPVVAACVLLNPNKTIRGLNDSKQINEKKRLALSEEIMEKALAYAIGICSPAEIDELNILKASFISMHKALDQVKEKFEHILVDGNRFIPYKEIQHTCVIKGDAKYQSIAAASILAKTERDAIMKTLHQEHPTYAWDKNKGYPTKEHRAAIAKIGASPHHRMSFQLLPVEQLSLFE